MHFRNRFWLSWVPPVAFVKPHNYGTRRHRLRFFLLLAFCLPSIASHSEDIVVGYVSQVSPYDYTIYDNGDIPCRKNGQVRSAGADIYANGRLFVHPGYGVGCMYDHPAWGQTNVYYQNWVIPSYGTTNNYSSCGYSVGNPVLCANGVKMESEFDAQTGSLRFVRTYTSSPTLRSYGTPLMGRLG